MLSITVPGSNDMWDEKTEKFVTTKPQTLQLEHSLVSISKWEAKYHKTFLSKKLKKTDEEMRDYIHFMTITQNVDKSVYYRLTEKNLKDIHEYMNNTMTATVVPKDSSDSSEPLTSELIYYYMVELGIPFECQKWHINRLITLINVCAFKKDKPKKLSNHEIMKQNRELNEKNKRYFKEKGVKR